VSHEHSHEHRHGEHSHSVAFAVGIGLNSAFVVLEAFYGVLSHSMALLADAGHNMSDVLALGLAWAASVLARRGPSPRFTYGWRSSSILVALFNAMLLMFITGAIAWEAIQRLMDPVPVAAGAVIGVAAIGIAVNGATALLFVRDRAHDVNLRAAFLHMAADAAVSLGVVVAGVGMIFTGRLWIDPAFGLVIAVAIVAGTWGLLRESVSLALDAVPDHIDPAEIRAYLTGLAGVAEVHDLHIWGMSTTETALTAHLVMPAGHPGDVFTAHVCTVLHERFRVQHSTIQVETGAQPCALAPDHVV